MSNEFENVEFEEDFNEIETYDGGKDYTTALGVAVIATGGVLVYEGGKRAFTFVKDKVSKQIDKHRKNKAVKSEPEEVEVVEETEADSKEK